MKSYHREHSDATTKHWTPGEPIPPANSGIDPDPYEALARSAEAYERERERQRFQTRRDTRPADRREAA